MASWIVGTGHKAQGLQNRMCNRKQPLSPLREGEPCRYVIIAKLSWRGRPSATASPGTWLLSKPGTGGRGACLCCVPVLTRQHHVVSQLEWRFLGSQDRNRHSSPWEFCLKWFWVGVSLEPVQKPMPIFPGGAHLRFRSQRVPTRKFWEIKGKNNQAILLTVKNEIIELKKSMKDCLPLWGVIN